MNVVGAGLAGLLAGALNPRVQLLEREAGPRSVHRALLRFRTPNVGRALGIDFRPVRVHKGLWWDNDFRAPTIFYANAYSHKVIGRFADRSIWNLEPSDRWIAPESLYDQLLEANAGRIEWGVKDAFAATPPLISTAPLPITAQSLRYPLSITCERLPIYVQRFRVKKADVYQTVYFPEADTPIYRASLTGSLLIVEAVAPLRGETPDPDLMADIYGAFALKAEECELLDYGDQRYGKINPVDEALRRRAVFELTQLHGVYSLGRFATWRNILLDDVLEDLDVIRRLMRSDGYEHKKVMT